MTQFINVLSKGVRYIQDNPLQRKFPIPWKPYFVTVISSNNTFESMIENGNNTSTLRVEKFKIIKIWTKLLLIYKHDTWGESL